ncbi:MAG: protein kinase [Myxococcota bacterium]
MKAYCHHCLSRIDHVSALRCPVCQRGSLPGGGWPRDRWLDCTVDSGKYRVESLLGMGGFGTVYAVRHTLVEDRVLAMKMLNALSNGDPVLEQMFLDEIRILMRLDHPNIVQCHEVGRLEDGSLFVLMEKIEGKQLDDIVVSPAQTMTPSQVVTLGLAIASALDAAHTHNVLHRDLKPPNVMLLDNGDVRVVDFGIAKILGPNTTGHRLSQVVGTPLFMAPEQFAAGNRIDRRLDIYQLGAVLYFALTGKPPYTTQQGGVSTLVQILEQQRSRIGREGPRPSTHKPALAQTAPVLDALVGRLLSTEVEQRPSSAAEVHELLNACPCRRPGRRTMVEQPLPAVVGSSLSSNTLPERMGSPLQPPPNTPRSIPTAAEPNTPPEPSGGLQLPSRAPPKVGSPPLSPPEGNTPDVLRASPLPGATARQTGTTTSGNSLLKLLLIGGGLVVVCGGLAVVGMIVVTAFMATTVLSEEDCCGEWTDSTIMGAKQLDEHRERGDTYYYGRGQKRDYTKAAESYDRSCRGSMGLGCANLGRLYERGRGVEKSLHNALLLYRRGCIKGHGEACTLAGAMYDEGRGTTRDLLRAAELFEEACETEDAPDGRGCSNLGYRTALPRLRRTPRPLSYM